MSAASGAATLLGHLNRLLVSATDLPEVIDAALDLVLALGAINAAVMFYDRESEELVLAGQRNHPDEIAEQWRRIPLTEETMITRAVRHGDVQVVEDLLAVADQLPKAAESARRTGFRTAVAVPLIVGGEVVGAIACGLDWPPAPEDERVAALGAIGQTIAIAIRHTRIAEIARQREADHTLIANATRLFNSTLDLTETLQNVAQIAGQALGDACMILLVEPESPELSVAANYHRDPAQAKARQEFMLAHPPHIDDGLTGEIIRTRKPILVSDPATHPLSSLDRTYAEAMGVRSWIGAPIVYRGEPLGVLAICSTTEGVRFGERELNLAVMLADSAAPAIANARLFRRVSNERLFLQSVLDNLPEAVLIVMEGDDDLTVINRAARDLLGHHATDGATLREWVRQGSWRTAEGTPYAGNQHPLVRALHGETILAHEMTIQLPTGAEISILGNFAPIVDRHRQVTGAVAVMQDITRRRELDQEKDDFLAIAAHELRTPLTMIRGQIQLLVRDAANAPDPLRNRLLVIQDQVERMNELATRLLDVSRIGMGRLDLSLDRTELSALVKEVCQRFRTRTREHAIISDVPPHPVIGLWDRARIEEVASNLLDNAIRYSPGGGQIRVEVTDEGDYARVDVQDEGIGIDPEVIPRLFQRYVRVDRPAEEISSGIGLGLFICRSIVEAHGGSIDVDSRPGAGTTFSIRLPKEPPRLDQREPEQ